jgi:hypothetical protein
MRRTSFVVMLFFAGAAAACGDVNAALERLSDARRVAADLHVQFTKASDAANRAVMAITDESSSAFAHESEQASASVQADVDALRPMLAELKYADETRILDDFVKGFAEYRGLDRTILNLAVQNTNLKAQRLSFGSAQDAANTFRDSLQALSAANGAKDQWHVRALVATAVLAVRDIQVSQAPHIAETDDAVMDRMEQSMATSAAAARKALADLAPLVAPATPPRLADASAALNQFMNVNAQIIDLSRKNTNVRSLALSLDQKRRLTKSCDDRLHTLEDALAKRGYPAGR